MADIKYSLEDNVKQNFIEPLHQLQTKDLKEVNHHRKKTSGRRLDYDCKKRKQTKGDGAHVSEADIQMAEEKFEESKQLTETAMYNVLENDVEQISQLSSFIEAELNYHRQTADVLQGLYETIQERCSEAASRPRGDHVPKRVTSFKTDDRSPMFETPTSNNFGDVPDTSGYSLSPAPPAYNGGGSGSHPCCEALYDFEPENEGELGFREGDIIQLISRIDENWFEGSLKNNAGYFPSNYVKVIVPL